MRSSRRGRDERSDRQLSRDRASTAPSPVRRLDHPRCALGESARWAHGRWWWVDAVRGTVWSAADGFTDLRHEVRAGPRTSLVHPATDGRMVVARGEDLMLLDPALGELRAWAHVDVPPGWVLNDGTVDHDGVLWIGSVHPDRSPGSGLLHRVDGGGDVVTFPSGAALSNGMVWIAPGRLLLADSREQTLTQYEIVGGSDAREVGVRIWSLPPRDGTALPDGICLDAEGGLWVALYGAGEVLRLVDMRPVEVIAVPTPQVTSVALGGPDGRDLLITTAQEGMDAHARDFDRNAGALFVTRVSIPGAPAVAARAD